MASRLARLELLTGRHGEHPCHAAPVQFFDVQDGEPEPKLDHYGVLDGNRCPDCKRDVGIKFVLAYLPGPRGIDAATR